MLPFRLSIIDKLFVVFQKMKDLQIRQTFEKISIILQLLRVINEHHRKIPSK